MKISQTILVLLWIPLVVLISSEAQTRTISVPNQATTISQAIAMAEPGDIILVGCGTYHESNITLKSGVKLWSGSLQPDCVTIDARGQGRVFVCNGIDSTATVVGFTITGGLASTENGGDGGAIWCRNSSPRFSNCIIEQNTARIGGGMYCDRLSSPKLVNCILRGNSAVLDGGGIYWASSIQGAIVGCTFRGNSATHGAGIYCTQGSGLLVSRAFFDSNGAGNSGGGIYLKLADPVLANTVFAGNWGGLGGGAIACEHSSPRIINCTISGNLAGYVGGGFLCRFASPRLENSIVSFNELEAIHCLGSSNPILTRCNLYGNTEGNWSGPIAHQVNLRSNFSSDPLFCAPGYGNFSLHDASLCLPENNPDGHGELIGAFSSGCVSSE